MEEDLVLKEMIKKALEGKGVLAQLRATLRAAVFTCVDEHERTSGIHVPNPSALAVKHDSKGRLALQVVVDFLRHFDLHQTLNVLMMETDLRDVDMLPKEELAKVVASRDGRVDGSKLDKEDSVLTQLLQDGHLPRNTHPTPKQASSGVTGADIREGSSSSSSSLSPTSPMVPRSSPSSIKEPQKKGPEEQQRKHADDGRIDGTREMDGVSVAEGVMRAGVTVRKKKGGGDGSAQDFAQNDANDGNKYNFAQTDARDWPARQDDMDKQEQGQEAAGRCDEKANDIMERFARDVKALDRREGGTPSNIGIRKEGVSAGVKRSSGGSGVVRDGAMQADSYDYTETFLAEGVASSRAQSDHKTFGRMVGVAGARREEDGRRRAGRIGQDGGDDMDDEIHVRPRTVVGESADLERIAGDIYDYDEAAESPHAVVLAKHAARTSSDDGGRLLSSISPSGVDADVGAFGDGSFGGCSGEDVPASDEPERNESTSPERADEPHSEPESHRATTDGINDNPRVNSTKLRSLRIESMDGDEQARGNREFESFRVGDEEEDDDEDEQYYDEDDFDADVEHDVIHEHHVPSADEGVVYDEEVLSDVPSVDEGVVYEEVLGDVPSGDEGVESDRRMEERDFDEIEEAVLPGDDGSYGENSGSRDAVSSTGTPQVDSGSYEHSPAARASSAQFSTNRNGSNDCDADSIADLRSDRLQWELRMGLSADSSCTVSGGDHDDMGYEMEYARTP